MKLLSLTAKNIFSLGDVSLTLKDRGLTLITGWSEDENNGNMAGKSSLASNAPVWCLYGKTVSGVRADSVINTSTDGKPCYAEVMFEGIDGECYKVKRSRKPNELTFTVMYLNEHKMVTWKNLTKRNERDTQELIDKALGRDHKTFIQSDFFGQGREGSFLSLPGSEQRAVIEEILPLTSLDEWHTTSKDLYSQTEDIVKEIEAQIRVASEVENVLRKQLEGVRDQSTSWYTSRAIELSEEQAKLTTLQGIHSGLDEALLELKESLPSDVPIKKTLWNQEGTERLIRDDLATLSIKKDLLTAIINNLKQNPDTCMTCKQQLPDEAMEKNKEILSSNINELSAFNRETGSLESNLYLAQSIIGICKEALEVESRLVSKAEQSVLEEHIQIKHDESNPFKSVLGTMTIELSDAIALHNELLDELKTEVSSLTHYQFWSNAFGKDIKNILFEQVCPSLEEKANQYLRELNNGQIKVKFSTIKEMKSGDTKEEFCVTASSDTGSDVFGLFSGAEKQLTSFAVGMALSDLSAMQTKGASQFMILDEPFLYQSPENAENIVNFITQNLSDKSTILLISNEENLAGLIPNRVHVIKRKGVSSIA